MGVRVGFLDAIIIMACQRLRTYIEVQQHAAIDVIGLWQNYTFRFVNIRTMASWHLHCNVPSPCWRAS